MGAPQEATRQMTSFSKLGTLPDVGNRGLWLLREDDEVGLKPLAVRVSGLGDAA